MSANPGNTPKPAEPAPEKAPGPALSPAAGGGLKPWLPLVANLLLMPVMAYGTVHFLVLPKMQAGTTASAATTESSKKEGAAHGNKEAGKQKVMAPLSDKVLVNVAGTMGARYLLARITLVGSNPELENLVKKNDMEIRAETANALSVKTIADLEKPGARNLIRTELVSLCNNILGDGVVNDVFLTEFAIQ
jgi:flagellar FliL protein